MTAWNPSPSGIGNPWPRLGSFLMGDTKCQTLQWAGGGVSPFFFAQGGVRVREIRAEDITAAVARLCKEANYYLPDDVLKKVYHDNAARVLGLEPRG